MPFFIWRCLCHKQSRVVYRNCPWARINNNKWSAIDVGKWFRSRQFSRPFVSDDDTYCCARGRSKTRGRANDLLWTSWEKKRETNYACMTTSCVCSNSILKVLLSYLVAMRASVPTILARLSVVLSLERREILAGMEEFSRPFYDRFTQLDEQVSSISTGQHSANIIKVGQTAVVV